MLILPVVKNKRIEVDDIPCLYTGEIDQKGNVCGHGFAIPTLAHKNFSTPKMEGTWLNNKFHGISTFFMAYGLTYV